MITFSHDPQIFHSFLFPSSKDPYFKKIRSQNPFLFISENELQKTEIIARYVHQLWEHDGSHQSENPDPYFIVEQAKKGENFRCVEYATVTCAILWAYGIANRVIRLRTKDSETRLRGAGHVVNEVWMQDTQSWAMLDVQAGFLFKLGNILLSSVGVLNALQQNKSIEIISIGHEEIPPIIAEKYLDWILQYLFYFTTPIVQIFPIVSGKTENDLILVPLGAQNPKIFQQTLFIHGIYTHNINDFYQKLN
ncbi:transglutaminase domain-containing protein [Candidatus Nomurabacteria bacterium]|jgi:hypothetical protein|nr:MAG: transglutaminase domain-containing protein [Candidatus Nomurabacteria bacterium]